MSTLLMRWGDRWVPVEEIRGCGGGLVEVRVTGGRWWGQRTHLGPNTRWMAAPPFGAAAARCPDCGKDIDGKTYACGCTAGGPRETHCFDCGGGLSEARHACCDDCGWIVCPTDGACGCSYWGAWRSRRAA